MPLTKEQLLIPRYKCISLWMFEPKSTLGAIYEQPSVPRGGQWTAMWNWWDELSRHPHLFQLLPWWSDRDTEDMPEYVKCIKTPDQIIMPGEVFKVKWNDNASGKVVESGLWIFTHTNCYEPSTNEEYINQKQQ